jgi:predicted phosphodiesterase
MAKIRIIGDVHGYHSNYMKLIADSEYSIQVGDFSISDYNCLNGIDPSKHKIIGGNHDNYDVIAGCPHYLGDYGLATVGDLEFFFVRGERSVDWANRIEGVSWWRSEELTIEEGYKALDAYKAASPDVMISHGCPLEVLNEFATNYLKLEPSRTTTLLQAMLEAHRPKLWIFGHHHNSKMLKVGGCQFVCLDGALPKNDGNPDSITELSTSLKLIL